MDTYWNSNFPVTSKRLQSLRVCLCVCVRARARPRLLTQSSPTWQSVMSDTSAQTVSLYCFLLHFSFEPQGGAITSRSPDLGGSMPSTGIRESGQFSCSVVSDSLWPHGLQHARLPCPSPIPGAYSNSCPLSRWCHPTISSSVVPFSSHLQSFLASGSFQMSWFFASGGQSIGVRFSISSSNEYSGLISFRIDWLDLLAVQGTLKSLLQHHSLKASILRHSAFLIFFYFILFLNFT